MSTHYECMYLIPKDFYDKLWTYMDEHEKNKVDKLNKTENTTIGNEEGAFPDLHPRPDLPILNDISTNDGNDGDDDDNDDDNYGGGGNSENNNLSLETQNSNTTVSSPPSSPFINVRPNNTSTPIHQKSFSYSESDNSKVSKKNNKKKKQDVREQIPINLPGIVPISEINKSNENIPINLTLQSKSNQIPLTFPLPLQLQSKEKQIPITFQKTLNNKPENYNSINKQKLTISQIVPSIELPSIDISASAKKRKNKSPTVIQVPSSSTDIIKTNKNKSFRCKTCKENFGYLKDLNLHLLTKHPKSKQVKETNINSNFRCDICDIDFEKKIFLTEHERFHKNKNKPTKAYLEWINDNNDMKDSSADSNLIDLSSDDEQMNRSVKHLNSDDESMNAPTQTVTIPDNDGYFFDNYDIAAFQCKLCPLYFNSQKNLDRHLHNIHSSDKNYKSWLEQGKKRKLNKKAYESVSLGDVSNKKKKYDYNLEKPEFLCKLCDMYFTNQKSLDRHLKNIHDSNKDYVSWINKGKKRKIEESIGIKNNIDIPRKKFQKNYYKCKLCNTNFSKNNILTRHIKNIHSADENYISFLPQGKKRKDVGK